MQSITISIYSLMIVGLIPFFTQLFSKDHPHQPTRWTRVCVAQHQYLYIGFFFIASLLTAQAFAVPQLLINRLSILFVCFHCLHLLAIAFTRQSWTRALQILSLASPVLLLLLVLR